MALVLTAETHAAARIQTARTEAARIITTGRQKARQVAERADQRVQALHACFRTKQAQREASQLQSFKDTHPHAVHDMPQADIDLLVGRLARRLIGMENG